MAPGLNGRQTGTVPKNKPRNSGSQSNRSPREALIHSASLDWEPVSEPSNRPKSRRKNSSAHSEAEADILRYDANRSRASTMTSQQQLVDNDNGEVSWSLSNGVEDNGQNSLSNASSRQSSHRGRQPINWPSNNSSNAVQNQSSCHEVQNSLNRLNIPDKKQVVNKLAAIQDYIRQTTALMNALKVSDSPTSRNQYEKLSAMLEDLKDSENKLSGLLNNMDRTESRIGDLLADIETHQGINNNNDEPSEEELIRKSEESKKKLEALQKRKQDLLELQERARKQLQEAQAEQLRLLSRANTINEELSSNKVIDINVQQLSQRLKNVQQLYKTRSQINENIDENSSSNREETRHAEEDQAELSDTETDFQLVSDKIAELNALKAQLAHMQKIMASVSAEQNGSDAASVPKETNEEKTQQIHPQQKNDASGNDGNNNDGINALKLEQAKSRLSQLAQLLEIVQNAQNSGGLSPDYLQLVSNMVNDEGESSTHSPSPSSGKSQQRPSEEISIETMQMMTRELEERTAAMKEERDKLLSARQQLQNVARRLPLAKPETESLSPDEDSESEPPCLLAATIDSSGRDALNASSEMEHPSSYNDSSPYACRTVPPRTRQRAVWNTSGAASLPPVVQNKGRKNEARGSNQSSVRGGARGSIRDQGRWSPSPVPSYCEVGMNSVLQTQNQLEITNNLCERMLADTLNRGSRPSEVSLEELFSQHQVLTKTVAQCSQLLWLQQKQITELWNVIMLQNSSQMQNPQNQSIIPNQSQVNVPLPNNQAQFHPFPNMNHASSVSIPPQNFLPPSQNVKLNAGDIQNHHNMPNHMTHNFSDQFCHQNGQPNFPFLPPDGFAYDLRYENALRAFNASHVNPNSNLNQNINQNASASGLNNRGPASINCLGPEDSGALNNQVAPGNRANNYWDNFRSYSRQNLLSNTKSNEESETYRRTLVNNQERIPREESGSVATQNNQAIPSQQTNGSNYSNSDAVAVAGGDQCLFPSNQNPRSNPLQLTRSRSVEPQNSRNPVKNESRNHENDSRNFGMKNEAAGGARARIPEGTAENIRSFRNNVSQSGRNADNVNAARNFVHLVRDFDNDEVAQGNIKKRLEKTRCRNEGRGNLNNRSDINNGLFLVLRENVYSEVTNFIQANENQPQFLIQLFRDLQQVTTDSLRQRTLESIQETVNANNLTERSSNGSNVNIIENRNNIRENRSNLNRNQTDEPGRIDELFYQLRENQNTIRQNIGSASFPSSGGSNSENSNIRNFGNSRNNLENEGLRDLRTYYEANLCNFGHNSTLENPNLSNIRENLTRRGPNLSDSSFENSNPKNVYLSMYDNIVEDLRRRNQESSSVPEFLSPLENFRDNQDFTPPNHFRDGNRPVNRFSGVAGGNDLEDDFDLRDGNHFSNGDRSSRFGLLDRGDHFMTSRDFLTNENNDSGIDINYDNDDRKRNFLSNAAGCESSAPAKKTDAENNENEDEEDEGAVALMPPDWERKSMENTFISSLGAIRNEMSSFMDPSCENSSFVTFQPSDNGDLAEADQSRNEETSGAESENGLSNLQTVEPESAFSRRSGEGGFSMVVNHATEPEGNFSAAENESADPENNFVGEDSAAEPEGNFAFQNSASEPESNYTRQNEMSDNGQYQWNDNSDCGCHLNSSSESDVSLQKSGSRYTKRKNEAGKSEGVLDYKKGSAKNPTNKFRDNTSGQSKSDALNGDDFDVRRTSSDGNLTAENSARTESRESNEASGNFSPLLTFQFGTPETDRGNASPEADADWELENGLDQVPTRLEKNGKSPRKPA